MNASNSDSPMRPDIALGQPTLDQVFLALTGHEARDDDAEVQS